MKERRLVVNVSMYVINLEGWALEQMITAEV